MPKIESFTMSHGGTICGEQRQKPRMDPFMKDMQQNLLFTKKLSYKALLPPLRPNEGPTFVNHKQVNRIIKMRQKRQKKFESLGIPLTAVTSIKQSGIRLVSISFFLLIEFGKQKCPSRVVVAKKRARALNGQFQSQGLVDEEKFGIS